MYVARRFSDTVDFDPSNSHPGDVDVLTSQGSHDIFVAKYDPTGLLIWSRQMGGDNLESAVSLDVDASSNIIVSGFFVEIADFDCTNSYADNRDLLESSGQGDGFVAKLDNSGNFLWATGIHGDAENTAWVATDSIGNVYVSGVIRSSQTSFGPFSAHRSRWSRWVRCQAGLSR